LKPEKLIYTFVSYAAHYDTDWGQGTAVEGIDRTATIAHKHGIPVTWIVNGGSVPVLTERIRAWHELYGDDVILQTPFFIEDCGASKEQFKQALQRDWQIVEEAFPWVTTKVAARGKIYNEVIEALEELEFKGMWGYCWEQVWWDGITHKGVPWGSWYVDRNRFNAPHPGKGKIVACEWTARDLNLTYHSESPVIYSTDPDDVYRSGLCTGEDIEYWKNLFYDYLDNTDHNEQVYFLQQQEGHEMEFTEQFAVFNAAQVGACGEMLDRFFAYISSYPITRTTLPKAVALYHAHNEVTAPSYMLTQDTLVRPEINDYTMALGGAGFGPWPETFLYYDQACQMAFVKGECKPHMLRNYLGADPSSHAFKEEIPQVFITGYSKTEHCIELTYEIDYEKPIPFGLVYWDDLSGFDVVSNLQVIDSKIIKDKLAFIRLDLTGGYTTFTRTLIKKEG
jgi:hypothetical protein